MQQSIDIRPVDTQMLQRIDTVRAQSRTLPWKREHDDAALLRAWRRCRAAGLDASDNIHFEPVSRALLAELDDTHHELAQSARPHLESVRNSIGATGCMAILTNQRGVVLDSFGRPDLAPGPLANAARKGINLDERCIGSTAPSLALADRQPSLVLGDAHFCVSLRKFMCAAAPIESPGGQLLGALDISAYDQMPRFDIMSLVEDTACAIENSLFRADADHVLLRFQVRHEWIDTPRQAIVSVRSDGRIVGANRIALSLLGLSRQALLATSFRDVFDRDPNRLFRRWRHPDSGFLEIATRGGLLVMGRLECDSDSLRTAPLGSGAPAAAPRRVAAPLPSRDPGAKLVEIEMSAITDALQRLGGNVSKAARLLGVSRNTIYRRLAARADRR